MKRHFIGAAVLALVAAVDVGQAAEPISETPSKAPWYTRWFGLGPQPPKAAPPAKRNPTMEASAQRAAAEAEYNRRIQVCDELQQVALETNNTGLGAKADALRKQAFDLYCQQTAHLPCARLMPSSMTDQIGEKSTAAAADRLMNKPLTPSRTSQANAFREIRP